MIIVVIVNMIFFVIIYLLLEFQLVNIFLIRLSFVEEDTHIIVATVNFCLNVEKISGCKISIKGELRGKNGVILHV